MTDPQDLAAELASEMGLVLVFDPADLAKRAVACAGFRWMSGMMTVGRSLCVSEDGPMFVEAWRASDVFKLRAGFGLPDLDDPATLGCFEHGLLPEAGYNDAHLDASQGPGGGSLWWVVYRPDPVSFPNKWLSAVEDGSPTKAAALVAALEAAPQPGPVTP